MACFDSFAERQMIMHRVNLRNAKLTDKSAEDFEGQKSMLKRRFDSMMLWPTRIYMAVGILFAIAIAALLFSGISPALKPFVILMPLPAIAYYLTAVLTEVFIFIHFDSFMHDKELPSEADTDDSKSDIDAVMHGAQSLSARTKAKNASIAGTTRTNGSSRKNGNRRKAARSDLRSIAASH